MTRLLMIAMMGALVFAVTDSVRNNAAWAQSPTPAPANDNFADATVIAAIPFSDGPFSTAGATTEPGEPSPCGTIGTTVWYSFTPTQNGTIGADTFGSDYDTVLAVYTGNSLQ